MYIGVDIGGSKILVVAGTARDQIVRQTKIETPASGDEAATEIIRMIEEVAAGETIAAIGVGAAGAIDRERGILLRNDNTKWEPVPLGERLKGHFKVPVQIENDADTAGLSEAHLGAAAGQPYVLYVTVSTGVGTGLIIDGKIYHGAHGTEGGHMYIHAEGKREEFEVAVGGRALKRRFGKFGYEITDSAQWDEFATDLAEGLYNFITLLSPSIMIIGGGIAVHFAKFEKFLNQHIKELDLLYPPPPIVPAKHIETAVAYGTLILASELAESNPQ